MLKHFFRKLLSTRINGVYISNHKKELIRFCESAGVTLSKRGGETDFINKWKPIYANVNVDFYRFYANFCGYACVFGKDKASDEAYLLYRRTYRWFHQ